MDAIPTDLLHIAPDIVCNCAVLMSNVLVSVNGGNDKETNGKKSYTTHCQSSDHELFFAPPDVFCTHMQCCVIYLDLRLVDVWSIHQIDYSINI